MLVIRGGKWSMASIGGYEYERVRLWHHWTPICKRLRRGIFLSSPDGIPYVKDDASALSLLVLHDRLFGTTIRHNCYWEPSQAWQIVQTEWAPKKRRSGRKRFVGYGATLTEATNDIERIIFEHCMREDFNGFG